TRCATERAAALAEKTGNLKQLFNSMVSRFIALHVAGDFPAADALADQTFQLALREGGPTSIALAHEFQMFARSAYRWDLAGVEQHFAEWLKYFEEPGLRQFPGALVAPLGTACSNAWLMGHWDLARTRDAQMMMAIKGSHPYDQAFARAYSCGLWHSLREYQRAEVLAAELIELSEKNEF